MKILVINNLVPFIRGGAEKLAENLVLNLKRSGHEADLMRIPFRWTPAERVYDEMLACRMLRVFNVDRVIGLKFPAYLIPHPHKTLWLVHQYRQAYDLASTEMANLPAGDAGRQLQTGIRHADDECFDQCNEIYCISDVVRKRLKKFNHRKGHVLHPPLDDPEKFRFQADERYIFAGGRINSCKRQHLLVEAMRYTNSDLKLIVAGPPDQPEDGQRLVDLVKRYKLQDRVQIELAFHPREKLVDWVNRATACACVPYDEDYGYVTLEAFYASKPVLTTHDAGGVLDFVTDGATGKITDPSPKRLAMAIDELAEDPRRTIRMGEAARDHIQDRNITWDETVKKLVA